MVHLLGVYCALLGRLTKHKANMTKYTQSAARKMANLHANEMTLCDRYMKVCKRTGDKQGAKDFARLAREHAAAFWRYLSMATWEYRHNLEVGTEF